MVYFDLETTGLNHQQDRIVQICIIVQEKGKDDIVFKTLINPEIPIPKEASDIHGITDEDVKGAPTFKDIADNIYSYFKGELVCGYNSNFFDVPFLDAQMRILAGYQDTFQGCTFLDAMKLYAIYRPRTLSAAYEDLTGSELEDAHDAEVDVRATIDVFKKAVDKLKLKSAKEIIETLEADKIVDFSGLFVKNEENNVIFAKGKHKGEIVMSNYNHRNYLSWVVEKSDFSMHTKNISNQFLNN